MKPPHLAIILSAGILCLGGCSLIHSSVFNQPTQDATSAQPLPASNNLATASKLAWDAAVIVQHPPHPVDVWKQAKDKWQQAIALLEPISNDPAVAAQVKEKLPTYRENYAVISARLAAEQRAADHLQEAQNLAWQAAVAVQNPPHALKVWQTASSQWQDAIALLEKIPKTTTAFAKSQEKLVTYRNNYDIIHQRAETETSALIALKKMSETAVQLSNLAKNKPEPSASNSSDQSAIEKRSTDQNSTGQNSTGMAYQDYTRMVQEMEDALDQFASQPNAKKHLIYTDLEEAVEDHKRVLKLWQSYTDFKKNEPSGLHENAATQFFPVSAQESATLIQKYGVRTYGDGNQVSLKWTTWQIWQHANQRIRQAQQKMLSLK